MFVGTPQDWRIPNLEKPLGRSRPPFLAPEGTTNVAIGKQVYISDKEPIVGKIMMITDGDKEGVSYVELGPFLQHVTIDLGAPHQIYAVVVWHYHKEPRVYFDVVVQVADDAHFITNVRTVFNNDIDNSGGFGLGKDMHYTETNEGKLIDARVVKARYVRLYSNGNNSNDLNHYVEVEVYGKPIEELESSLPKLESSSKQELVDALADLERAIIKKIQLEVDVTAQCFTSVKEYRRARLLADVLRPVLRVIQGTLSVISKIRDATSVSGQVKTSLDNAKSVSEVASLFFMINGLREAGQKLYYAIDDTAGYAQSVSDMVDAADQTTFVRMYPDSYKNVIKHHLDGIEGGPLVITRTSNLAPDRKAVQGAFILQRIIREEFKSLVDEIQRGELTQEFPVMDAISQIEQLKRQIVESGTRNIDVHYSIYHRGARTDQNRRLGAIAEHNKAFASIAGAVADRLRLEIHAEYAQLAGTGADVAYIVTYNIPGAREATKMTQQVTLLPGIVIEGKKMFTVDPEEEFYQMPQEMLFSLAIEFSNLWRIADDTVLSLMELLKESGPTGRTEKTFYDQAEEDRRRLLAQPQTTSVQPTARQGEAQQPVTLYFKELSEIDNTEAENLLSVAAPGRSIGRLPMTGYKLMVDSCRIIMQRWPESWYAYRAKQMLAEMLPRDQTRYKVTPEELDLSMFARPRPGTKPFIFKEGQ